MNCSAATLSHSRPTQIDRRTRALLERPLLSTLLKLAAPNAAVMITQLSVPLAEMYFIAKLGVDALAGVSEVPARGAGRRDFAGSGRRRRRQRNRACSWPR